MQDIIESTQFGDLDRCTQYVNEGYDVNQRDIDNVTLLHWAALNDRQEIAELYIINGATVNTMGGSGQDTPLHWAAQKGHLRMVVLLLNHGANPTLRDGAGCTVIHRAAQEGYISIVAYLLAKGISPNIQDRGGMTPLMWSACWNDDVDISKLLLSFGASTSIQDNFLNNTALHWAIYAEKPNAITLLFNRKANFNIRNYAGETAYSLLQKIAKENNLNDDWTKRVRIFLRKAVQNRNIFNRLRASVVGLLPFLGIYALGSIFSANLRWVSKLILSLSVVLIGKLAFKSAFDTLTLIPIHIYFGLAIKTWGYIVWFKCIHPAVSILCTKIFTVASVFLWYFFICICTGDPGFIVISEEERNKAIIELAEEDGLNSKYFCTTCLVKKPLLSRHCRYCDRCVARFDHHCSWLSNCIGWKTHKCFIGYLFFVVFVSIIYVIGTYKFWNLKLGEDWSIFEAFTYEPWINFMMILTIVSGSLVAVVLLSQLYQILWLGWASKQRLIRARIFQYDRRRSTANEYLVEGSVGKNLLDFLEIDYWSLNPDKTDWMREWPQIVVNENKWEW